MKFKILSKKGVAVVLAATLAMGSFVVSATGLIDEPVFYCICRRKQRTRWKQRTGWK